MSKFRSEGLQVSCDVSDLLFITAMLAGVQGSDMYTKPSAV